MAIRLWSLLLLLTTLLLPGTASASTPTSAETRVGAFDFAAATLVGVSDTASPGTHQGNRHGYDLLASGETHAARGAGYPGWATIGEVSGGGAIGQTTGVSCGPACGEMISGISQSSLLRAAGASAAPDVLGAAIGGRGGFVGFEAFGQLVGTGRPWIAMMRGSDALHYVVVDGLRFGKVLIRDPWAGGTAYKMTQEAFMKVWTGVAVGTF